MERGGPRPQAAKVRNATAKALTKDDLRWVRLTRSVVERMAKRAA